MKHITSPSKHDDGQKRHKPEDQQTPPWANDILKEMREMKTSLGAKCDDAKEAADLAKKSADETRVSLQAMDLRIKDLESRLQALEAEKTKTNTNKPPPSSVRSRSQGARVTEDEEQRRLRTAVATGWERDSLSQTIKKDVQDFLKDMESLVDINVKVFTPGPRCSMAFMEFEDEDLMMDFLRVYDNKNPTQVNSVKIYCHPNKTREERSRDHAIRKFWRTLLTNIGAHQDRFARNYHRGIVWVDRVRVAEWDQTSSKLIFHEAQFNALNLGMNATAFKTEWDAIMG
eukprot:s11_g46.t1